MWRLMNPLARPLAGIAPFWVVLETIGRRSGEPRQVPLARGPIEDGTAWLIAVHGEHSTFARNIAANPRVRLRVGRRWRAGTASLTDLDEGVMRRFSRYAQAGPRTVGIDPKLVRIELDPGS
jgi:deazaflavin-dependent oxidoreductase (nitroreductase family)